MLNWNGADKWGGRLVVDWKLCTTCGSSTGEKQKTFRLFNMVFCCLMFATAA
jgi:hypothetical protein